MHVLGQAFTFFYIIVCFSRLPMIFLLLAPLVVYPFAWSGHYFFEKNEPAAFKNPWYAKMSDLVMLKDWILGRIER